MAQSTPSKVHPLLAGIDIPKLVQAANDVQIQYEWLLKHQHLLSTDQLKQYKASYKSTINSIVIMQTIIQTANNQFRSDRASWKEDPESDHTDDDWPSDVTPPTSPPPPGIEKDWKASENKLSGDPKSTQNPYLVSTQCRCQHHDGCSSLCKSHTATNLHTGWTNPLRVIQANFLPLDRLEAYYIQLANMMPDVLMESEDDILQELTKKSKLGDGLKTKGDDFFHIQSKLPKAQRNAREAMESKYKSLEGHLPNSDRVGFVRIYKDFWRQIFSKTTWSGPQQFHTERAKNLYRVLKVFLEHQDPKSLSAKWFVEACPF